MITPRLLALCFCSLLVASVLGQSADAAQARLEASTTRAQLGEVLEITLIVRLPEGASLVEWPELPEDETLDVLSDELDEATEEAASTASELRRTWRVALWRVGTYLSPSMTISYRLGGAILSEPVQSVSVEVPSLLADADDLSPRPSIPPLDLVVESAWMTLLLVAIPTPLLALLILRFFRRDGPPTTNQAEQLAIRDLEDLASQNLPPGLAYPLVAAILRDFLQNSLQISTREMTSREVIDAVREDGMLPDSLRADLAELLEQADLVKFARAEPDSANIARFIRFARRWLRQASQVL
ncbi:MAG: hypothetical protein NZ750_03535 [Anaerolineae bacterium]|nr:hypothetical protein [Anaerolineae bacterium]MDW8171393.1 hypothetical protein [Anaerolineae bacterium]